MKTKTFELVAVTIYVIAAMFVLSGCQDNPFVPDIIDENEKPSLQTQSASEVKDLSAILNANILDDGGANISDRGFYLSTQSDPRSGTRIAGSSQGSQFSAQASALVSQTTYYVQAYATNSVGTGYGQVVSFTTGKTPVQAKVDTKENNTESTFTEATLRAKLANPDNLAISQTGFILASDAKLSSGKRDIVVTGQKFEVSVSGLQKNTKYFFCAYATTPLGTSYGDTLSFKTAVFELEGDYYHSVIIGSQEWIVENLHVTKFRNGDPISNVKDNQAWSTLTSPAYCAYDNNEAIADTCGYLYNQFVVRDPRDLGPEGWRVPTNNDFYDLVDYLGGQDYYVAMAMMSTNGWLNLPSPEEYNQPTNSTGFSAKPSGWRRQTSERQESLFGGLGEDFCLWSTFYCGFGGEILVIFSEHPLPDLGRLTYQQNGFSVRLVRGK